MLVSVSDSGKVFRMHMRSLLWDMGRVEWRAHTILQADS